MNLTHEQVNEIIFRGMGYERHHRNTAHWTTREKCGKCDYKVYDLPNFVSWPGFGMIMEWYENNVFDAFEIKQIMEVLTWNFPTTWPKIIALRLASHFAGEQVKIREE